MKRGRWRRISHRKSASAESSS